MTTTSTDPRIRMILHWAARVLSIASVGIILAFFIGEGFDPSDLSLRDWSLFVWFPLGMVVGLILAWRWEGLGSFVAIGSLIVFYAVHAATSNGRFPEGGAFAMFTAPALLFLLSWWSSRRGAQSARG